MNLLPPTLEGTRVTLLPLHESHISGLIEAANDPNIWSNTMTPLLSPAEVHKFVYQALNEQEAGQGIPFSVMIGLPIPLLAVRDFSIFRLLIGIWRSVTPGTILAFGVPA